MVYFLTALIIFYIAFTLRFQLLFNKTQTYFSKSQMILQNILIWLIPFVWIIILKTLIAPTPGSHQAKRKADGGFYESGLTGWGDGDSGHHGNGHS